MKIEKYYGKSVVGICYTCGQTFEDYMNRREGYYHAKTKGHTVRVEITNVFHYN